jgi:metal-responsive CopG/Arc/MetJ family transcriptional regulator
MSRRTKQISITVDDQVLEALDAERGHIPRSTYITDMLFYALATEEDLSRAKFSEK